MTQSPSLLSPARRARIDLAHRCLAGWYRCVVTKRILATQPVICDRDCPYEIHTLTFDQDLPATLWSLKTWYHFSGTRPALVIYAGGPLSAKSEAILSAHFPTCRIIRRKIFNQKMQVFLNNYKTSLRHSITPSFYCALKLFGPMCFAQTDSILYVDSDVLFFRKPVELLKHLERQSACFNSDYQNAYAHPAALLNSLLPFRLEHGVNAGLFHISKKDLDGGRDLAEHYFTTVPEIDHHSWTINRHEQTLNALLLSRANAKRLSADYQIAQTPVTDTTVSHHFVNDGSRPAFYRVGMRRLVSSGFLTATAPDAMQRQALGVKA
ncbi:MAG: hypothetical protein FJ119_03360 [Deltaproteobacteria bacterium]|nr:hypothetical protein [Deltaproteobacteria bacterium]